ncbi:Zn-dependent protease with chaperone function [Leptolyngbya sp. PCC 6406]|uniref:Zn-dependent protease with chaperone function n=1 Tax=Leptolyngbya sp. PCC 6406 TaxID=1173264 RepID=UPI0002AC058A|nr:Zn-dependent protease with chaperone function [Leptolyngbya sp. PCC 6406]
MHSGLLLLTLLIALVWRWQWRSPTGSWQGRWQSALSTFCLPPLMVILAAGVVLMMGHHGTMMGWSVSPMGCWLSGGILGSLGAIVCYSLGQALATELWLRQHSIVALPHGGLARCIDIDLPVVAVVGLYPTTLVVSRGWLTQFTPTEQQAMLAHEQAHIHYGDPMWFMGLSILRQFSGWLPQTQALWEELLLLREMRADHRAAASSDPLLLAELLVSLCRQIVLATQKGIPLLEPYLAFDESLTPSRLEQRVNALLDPNFKAEVGTPQSGELLGILLTALPLATPWWHA